jgi:hypothetical protein
MFLHNLLNALVQIANKMGLQKEIRKRFLWMYPMYWPSHSTADLAYDTQA